MAQRLLIRGGTQPQNDIFVGALRELSVDTDNWNLRIHDGITPGGHRINSTGNYIFDHDIVNMPDHARLVSGGISAAARAEFGTVINRNPNLAIVNSEIYMISGTGEIHVLTNSSNQSSVFAGVINAGNGVNGLSANSNSTAITGGTGLAPVAIEISDAGVSFAVPADSLNHWTFGPDGSLEFPDGTKQETAFILEGEPEPAISIDGGGAYEIYELDLQFSDGGRAASIFSILDPLLDGRLANVVYSSSDFIINGGIA